MIAYVCGSESWGGLEMNHLRNATWMSKRGHQVIVFGILNSSLHKNCQENNIPFEGIQKHKKHFDFRASVQLLKLVRKHEIKHIVMLDGFDMGLCTMSRALGFYSFQLHYFMDMQLGCTKKNIAQTLRFRQLNSWICPLPYLKREVLKQTKVNPRRIHLLPMAVDLTQFDTPVRKSEARKLLNLESNITIIGIAGRIDPKKGQLLALEALKLIDPTTFHLVILGGKTHNEGESYMNQLLAFIKENDLTGRVHFRPFMK